MAAPIVPRHVTLSIPLVHCNVCGTLFPQVNKQRTQCSATCRNTAKRICERQCKERRKQRLRSNTAEVFDPAEVFERDGWRCQLCGDAVRRYGASRHPKAATLDHIVPLARGGEHSRRNTQCACRACNLAKWTK